MSPPASAAATAVDKQSREFYRAALSLLDVNNLPYLVGGAYAFARYTGIERHTKDFDIFIRRRDYDRASTIFEDAGYETELTFSHWLGKAFCRGEDFVDLIFGSGNGLAVVDDSWFEYSVASRVLDMDVRLIPAEEMIWSKGMIMERERYDGADVIHVIHATGDRLDWRRLIDRYDRYWRALYAHLILFGFVYPFDRSRVPVWVMEELGSNLVSELHRVDDSEKICYGTILSRQQYLADIDCRGYEDARLKPHGNMTAEEIAHWTAGIARDGAA